MASFPQYQYDPSDKVLSECDMVLPIIIPFMIWTFDIYIQGVIMYVLYCLQSVGCTQYIQHTWLI